MDTVSAIFFKVTLVAFEVFRLGQAGNGGGTGRFIFLCDLQIGEIFCDDALRRGGFFYLADKGHARLFQRLFKRESGVRVHRRCFFFHFCKRTLLFFCSDTFSCGFCNRF